MGQFFIADKPYKNMLKLRNGRTASEEKGALRQTDDDRTAQDLFKRLPGKCNDRGIGPLGSFLFSIIFAFMVIDEIRLRN